MLIITSFRLHVVRVMVWIELLQVLILFEENYLIRYLTLIFKYRMLKLLNMFSYYPNIFPNYSNFFICVSVIGVNNDMAV